MLSLFGLLVQGLYELLVSSFELHADNDLCLLSNIYNIISSSPGLSLQMGGPSSKWGPSQKFVIILTVKSAPVCNNYNNGQT